MHQLPKLPYSYDALEPHIDARTMKIHHTKHHQRYVDKLNDALKSHPDLTKLSLEELFANFDDKVPSELKTAVRHNGGGHANHSLFWQIMGPDGGDKPDGALAKAIDNQLQGFDQFQQDFSNAAAARFGSGWMWLLVDSQGKLKLFSTPNQDSPLYNHDTPILGLDVWEHAYYLNYQNRRADYIKAWWQVINWTEVEQRYQAAVN